MVLFTLEIFQGWTCAFLVWAMCTVKEMLFEFHSTGEYAALRTTMRAVQDVLTESCSLGPFILFPLSPTAHSPLSDIVLAQRYPGISDERP